MFFIPNAGQTDPSVRFQARAAGGTAFFTASEMVLVTSTSSAAARGPRAARDLRAGAASSSTEARFESNVVRMSFVGAEAAPRMRGGVPLPGTVNYFLGNDPSTWRTSLPTFSSVVYEELYPGIDLEYDARGGHLKGTYAVAPGADPSLIRWRWSGVDAMRLDESGNLVVELPRAASAKGAGIAAHAASFAAPRELVEEAPVAWQERDGRRVPVATRFELLTDGTVGFALPEGYDGTRPLLLDPTLAYSTYLGGADDDNGYDIAVDATGYAYVTGYTFSTNFPTAGTPPQATLTAGADVFVAKLNPAVAGAASLVYSTYLGGTDNDFGLRIAVDGSGAAYVTGLARAGFPTTAANAYQPTYGGVPGADAFLTKLSAAGSSLVYSTYLGGSNHDGGFGLALGPSGHVWLVGETLSTNFPATTGAYKTTCGVDGTCDGGKTDVFVARMNPAASGAASLVWATYMGGSGSDSGSGVAVDAGGTSYLAGLTKSTNFPTAGTPYQAGNGGGSDAFVTTMNAAGTALAYSTYLGGLGDDDAYSIRVDASNRAYVTGTTNSGGFPTTASAFQTALGGGSGDAWFARLDPSAAGPASLLYATFLGGGGFDAGSGLAVDGSGNAYLSGYTSSTDYPVAGGPLQSLYRGNFDAFLTKVNPGASGAASVVYSTYFGGDNTDASYGIALNATGDIYLTGQTGPQLGAFPFPTLNPYQPLPGGASNKSDAFVVKIDTTVIPTRFFPLTPCRVVDTRNAAGPNGGPALDAGTSRSFPVGGLCGVPIGARAVAFNQTVTSPTDDGTFNLSATGQPLPVTTSLSFRAGRVRANNTIAQLGSGGAVTVRCEMPVGTAGLVMDVVGYFQ